MGRKGWGKKVGILGLEELQAVVILKVLERELDKEVCVLCPRVGLQMALQVPVEAKMDLEGDILVVFLLVV